MNTFFSSTDTQYTDCADMFVDGKKYVYPEYSDCNPVCRWKKVSLPRI